MFRPDFGFRTADIDMAGIIVVSGDPMPPPLLAGYAPVLDVVHPGKVDILVLPRNEFDIAVLNSSNCGLSERLYLDEPLISQERFDDCFGAIATRHHE